MTDEIKILIIRLGTKFVVLNRENGNMPVFIISILKFTNMNTLQETAIATISKLPHTANFESIIAALYEIRIKTEKDKINETQPTEVKTTSCLELALAHNLVGCIKNAPKDLSTNKGYMDGYGL